MQARGRSVAAFLLVGFGFCIFSSNAASAAVQYVLTDLGTIGGDTTSAGPINNFGEVSGYSSPGIAPDRAFVWTPVAPNATTGTIHDLGNLSGSGSHGFAINNNGQVTGDAQTTGLFADRAFLWTPTALNGGIGSMHDLGTEGGTTSQGYGINNSGQVVGAYVTGNAVHGFLYDTSTHDLGTLGGTNSVAFGINGVSHVVGYSDTSSTNQSGQIIQHAFLYDSSMHDLGTLGGDGSNANGINLSGQVVGNSQTSGNAASHAFLWTPNTLNGMTGIMQDLGSLGDSSTGVSVNASGVVVGYSQPTGSNQEHAFIYTAGTGMVDLNTLIDPLSGWLLTSAGGVNDFGQIAGTGSIGGNSRNHHGFLLTPVPEPSGFALAGLTVLPLIAVCRKRKSR